MFSSNLIRMVVFFIVNFAISSPAEAHGGGLDKHGCHNNRKTGDYHCHRGSVDDSASYNSLSSKRDSWQHSSGGTDFTNKSYRAGRFFDNYSIVIIAGVEKSCALEYWVTLNFDQPVAGATTHESRVSLSFDKGAAKIEMTNHNVAFEGRLISVEVSNHWKELLSKNYLELIFLDYFTKPVNINILLAGSAEAVNLLSQYCKKSFDDYHNFKNLVHRRIAGADYSGWFEPSGYDSEKDVLRELEEILTDEMKCARERMSDPFITESSSVLSYCRSYSRLKDSIYYRLKISSPSLITSGVVKILYDIEQASYLD